jgi:2,4-dienoyl-CoA reductase-like NADH-dependent reductase (Old Yellow Enzyme family)
MLARLEIALFTQIAGNHDMADHASSPVLQPVTIGKLALKNRIVMAPLTRSRSNDDGVPPAFAADYYSQRAGAGLVISEATNISRQAIGYALTPGIWSDEQVGAWRVIVDAVHQRADGCSCNSGIQAASLIPTCRAAHCRSLRRRSNRRDKPSPRTE